MLGKSTDRRPTRCCSVEEQGPRCVLRDSSAAPVSVEAADARARGPSPGLERDVESEKRKSRDLAETARVKEREYGKLKSQYDKVRRRRPPCSRRSSVRALTPLPLRLACAGTDEAQELARHELGRGGVDRARRGRPSGFAAFGGRRLVHGRPLGASFALGSARGGSADDHLACPSHTTRRRSSSRPSITPGSPRRTRRPSPTPAPSLPRPPRQPLPAAGPARARSTQATHRTAAACRATTARALRPARSARGAGRAG